MACSDADLQQACNDATTHETTAQNHTTHRKHMQGTACGRPLAGQVVREVVGVLVVAGGRAHVAPQEGLVQALKPGQRPPASCMRGTHAAVMHGSHACIACARLCRTSSSKCYHMFWLQNRRQYWQRSWDGNSIMAAVSTCAEHILEAPGDRGQRPGPPPARRAPEGLRLVVPRIKAGDHGRILPAQALPQPLQQAPRGVPVDLQPVREAEADLCLAAAAAQGGALGGRRVACLQPEHTLCAGTARAPVHADGEEGTGALQAWGKESSASRARHLHTLCHTLARKGQAHVHIRRRFNVNKL